MSTAIDAEVIDGTAVDDTLPPDATPPGMELDRPVPTAPPPATLFRTEDPAEIALKATAVADALSPILDRRNKRTNKTMTTDISGNPHVNIEGWQTLGTMLGVVPVTVWTRRLEPRTEYEVEVKHYEGRGAQRHVARTSHYTVEGWDWEAFVEARTLDGRVVGGAKSMVSRKEPKWQKAEDHALSSMAQTRASSKALKSILGFIVNLAGYEATPAEEMDESMVGTPRPADQALLTAASTALVRILGSDLKRAEKVWEAIETETGPMPEPAAKAIKVIAEQVAAGERPQPQARPAEASVKLITAAQKRKVWAAAGKAGIKEQEQLLRAIFVWVAGAEHTDRIPRDQVDPLLAAIGDHEAVLSEIHDRAADGDTQARAIVDRFLKES